MQLDCLLIGHNLGSHRMGRRSQWMNAQRATPSQVPADLGYVNQALEYLSVGDSWMEVFDLVNHVNAGTSIHDAFAELPNHACLLLAAYLRRRGLSARWVNSFDQQSAELARMLREQDPLVTCITTTLLVQPGPILDMIEFVRAHNPDTKIVLGGPCMWNLHSLLGAKPFANLLRFLGADYCVLESEGDATLFRLIQALKGARRPDGVPNLLWRDGDRFQASERVPEDNSMADLAVDWELFSRHELGPMVWLRTALSCAFKCAFCDFPARMGPLRNKSVEQVEVELKQLEGMGVKYVNFIDDTFNVPVDRFHDLLRMMVKNSFGMRWMSYFRLANVKGPETFDLVAESGCDNVYLGIESGDPAVLKNMVKGAPISRYRNGIEELNKRGIMSQASFVAGFPGETRETFLQSIRFVEETRPTFFHAAPFYYNSNAPVHGKREEFELHGRGFNWEHATMNSLAAHCAKELMFRAVKNSCWIPEDGFAIWSVPYLRAKGMSKDQVLELCGHLRDLLASNHISDDGEAHADAISSHVRRFLEANGLPDRRERASHLERAATVGALRRLIGALTASQVAASAPAEAGPPPAWLASADARIDANESFHLMLGRAWLKPERWKLLDDRLLATRCQQLARMQATMLPVQPPPAAAGPARLHTL